MDRTELIAATAILLFAASCARALHEARQAAAG